MNADDRLDRQIRSALEWQAERAASRAPSLSQSARTVASRLGPEPMEVRPTISFLPSSDRSLRLILVVLVLLLLIAATVAIGSRVLRDSFEVQPGPFGLSRACPVPMQPGVALEVRRGENRVTVYADGFHVTNESAPGGTFAAAIEGTVATQRRLNLRGVDLLLSRVAEAGLSPGCRTLGTRTASGSIRAIHEGGSVLLEWRPAFNLSFTRQATVEEELAADLLADSLEHPETWLPDDALTDVAVRRITPERWLLTVSLMDTEMPSGSTVTLGSGRTLRGTDPRYALVELPGGISPGDFGVGYPSPFSAAPGSSLRCGALSTAEALAAARSIDALEIPEDGSDSLHNDDMTAEVSFGFEPILHPADDCEAFMDRRAQATASPEPGAAVPAGDLAHVDPCTLVSETAMDVLTTTEQRVAPSRQPLGEAASACYLSGPPGAEPVVAGANVSLFPRRLDGDNARRLAESLFGEGLAEEPVDADLLWSNTCPDGSTQCGRAIAIWSDGYFVVIEFESVLFPASANVTAETARSFAGVVLDGLADRPGAGA